MKVESNKNVVTLVLTGLCTAVICVLSVISIPLPSGVPITLQTFAVALCSYIIGIRLAPLCVVFYIALGAIGLPVFAGFSSGVGILAQYTGGFLWGFILMAVLCGFGMRFRNKFFSIAFGLLGLLVCHLCGVIQFSAVAGMPFVESFLVASLPYLIKDAISVITAYFIALGVLHALKRSRLITVKS